MTETYTYYENEFRVTWEDGSKEIVSHESSHKATRLPRRLQNGVRIDEFSHTYTIRGLIFFWKKSAHGSFDRKRELNFEKIREIEFIGRESVEVEV